MYCLEKERLQSQLSIYNDEFRVVCNERDQLRNDNTELQVRVSAVSLKEYKQLQVASQSQTEKTGE